MKISYISLKKKIEEYKENKKKQKEDSEKETKYIGINYSKSDKENESKVKKIIQNLKSAPKGSYTLIIFMILLLVITTKLNIDTYSKLNKEEYDTYVLDEKEVSTVSNNNVTIYKEAVSSIYDRNEDYEETVETSSANVVKTNKNSMEDEKYVYEYTYLRPVEGHTMKEYSMDKVVYSKTLDMWKVHDGIDICANDGEEVKASEKGIVERVYEDAFYGTSVIIDHQNGIKTVYRNLGKEVTVKEKQEIKKGQKIGNVGDTSNGEAKDETHIHFEVIKNGEIVNPNVIGIK